MAETSHRIKPIDPGDYSAIVGASFVKRERNAVLTIGARSWSRYTLGRLGCPHPAAAASVNRAIQQLEITSMRALADRIREIGNLKGLGVTAYWLVLAILRESGYSIEDVHSETVTYDTIKKRSKKVEQRGKRRLRKRAGPPSSWPENDPETMASLKKKAG